MPRVLLVEDSATQATVIRIQLKHAGFETELAVDGLAALAAIAAAVPDLVLTDLNMPELDGAGLTAEIRGRYPQIPVLLTTTAGSDELAVRALKNGAVGYIPKAVLPQELKPTLLRILEIAATQPDPTRLQPFAVASGGYTLPCDAALMLPLVGHVKHELSRRALADETGILQMAVALAYALEALINLGSSARPIHFAANITLAKAVFTIRCEGETDPFVFNQPLNLDSTLGRGALLLQTFFDEVGHNAAGHELTLVKRRVFD